MSDLKDFVKRGQAAQAAVDKLGAGKPRHVDPEKLLAALKELTLQILNTPGDIRQLLISRAYRKALALIAESERSTSQ